MARHFLLDVGSLTGARLFILLSQVLVLPVVARYLDVSDFGDVALAMTVVIFAQILSDAGLGRSLIRKKDFDAAEWSRVFWLLFLVGALLAAAIVAVAPVWAWLFDRPALGALVAALSVVPFLNAVSAVPTARMERANRFPVIATIRMLAAVSGMVVAITFATSGLGAWALIGQQIAIATVLCGGAFAASGFRPMSPRVRAHLGDHLVFARNSIGVSVLFAAQQQVPVMMIGYVLGPAALGLYSMGQRILNLPQLGLAAPAAQVLFVRMSSAQENPERVGAIYIASIRLLALAVFPPMAFLAGVGETAFTLLLSDHWLRAATVFALAAPGIALEVSTSAAGVLFQAVNRTDLRLRMVLERTLLRLVMLAAALPFGIEVVAAAITVSAAIYLPRIWVHVGRAIRLDARAATIALLGPLPGSAVLWGACRWLQAHTDGWMTLGLAVALLLVVWGLVTLLLWRKLRGALAAITT